MQEYILNGSFDAFKKVLESQKEKFGLLEKKTITNSEELQIIKQERRVCYKETIEQLNGCFREADNELVRDFADTQVNGFQIPGAKKSIDVEIKEFRESCKSYSRALDSILLYSSLSDVITKPGEVDLEERSKMTVEERQVFILVKLSEANNGSYLDVKWILEANGIKLRHYNEANELVKELEIMGFVEILGSLSGLMAKITIQGVKYIEQANKAIEMQSDDDPQGFADMCSRMDEIKEYLEKAGVEREILFEEMEELKELYTKLNKKNWKQLVLGKLGGLALGKFVENDTINFIYEKLTGEHMKFLH